MKSFRKQAGFTLTELLFAILGLTLAVVGPLAWVTHVIHCIQNEEWFFLIAGAIAFPIAIVHGVGLWFGLF